MIRPSHKYHDTCSQNAILNNPLEIGLLSYGRRKASTLIGWWLYGCLTIALPISTLLALKQLRTTIPPVLTLRAVVTCGAIAAACFAVNAARSISLGGRLLSLCGIATAFAMLCCASELTNSNFLRHHQYIKCGFGLNPRPRVKPNTIRLATGCSSLGPLASFTGHPAHQLPSDYLAVVDWGNGKPKVARIIRPTPAGPFIVIPAEDDTSAWKGGRIDVSVLDIAYNAIGTGF